jgi:hypothetical protein
MNLVVITVDNKNIDYLKHIQKVYGINYSQLVTLTAYPTNNLNVSLGHTLIELS